MKKTILLLIVASLIGCAVKLKAADGKQGADGAKTKNTETQQTQTFVTPEAIKKSMNYLASDALEGRNTGTEGIEKAAVFIEQYLKNNNIKPYFETYRDSFNLKDIVGYNIVGIIEGNDPVLKNEFVILGGHYDHIGTAKAVGEDVIANGANDDASGTIAAMEFGKYFSESKTNKRSILITLYSAEEMGLKGSAHLANRLKKAKLNVYTMLNFEMIGVPRAADQNMAYMSGYERSNFAEILNNFAGEALIGFFPKAKAYQLFKRSDNYPFYEEFTIPAHAISTFDFTNFDYYHHVDDEADKIDYNHMANFINKMIPALEGMINTPTKEVTIKQ